MIRLPTPGEATLPLADLLHIDACCDRFEAAWRDGTQPALEAFLADAAPLAQGRLLRELLILDLEFRREAGERPEASEYLARFPTHADLVARAFSAPNGLDTLGSEPPGPANAATEAGQGLARAELGPDARAALREAGYEILGELGRGGMGVVYLANKVALNRQCALKMILAGAHAGPALSARFRTEAETIAQLHDPGIVQIYHVGEAAGLPYFELEYLPGGSLDKLLAGAPWPAPIAAELVGVLARSIAEAHRQGVIHRDLKPANILLDAENRPKVADFGLAKVLDTDDGITKSQMVLGSPCYMAPEQAEGHSKLVGPSTDVYALGAIFYELLTGRPPFRAPTSLETLNLVRTADPVPPSRFQPGLPKAAETICLKCLEKPPARRYVKADDLAEDLRRFTAGEPILAHPAPPWEQAWRWTRRRPALAAAGGVALAALLVLIGGSLYYNARLRLAVQKARAAERGAVAQRNLALGAFNQLVYDVQERLGEAPATRPARRALLKTAIQGLDEIARGTEGATPDLSRAVAHVKLGAIYGQVGMASEARRQFAQGRALAAERVAAAPRDLAAAACLRDACAGLGALAISAGRPADAKADLHRAVALSEQIARLDPQHDGARRAVIEAYLQLGRAYAFNGERTEAEARYQTMHDLAARWVADEPGNALARDLLSSSHRKLADERKLLHDYAGSRPHYEQAIALGHEAVAAEPENLVFKQHLTLAVDDLAGVSAAQGRYDEARTLFGEAEQLCVQQIKADPENNALRLRLYMIVSRSARLERDALQFAQAAALYRRAGAQLDRLLRDSAPDGESDYLKRRQRLIQAEIARCDAAPALLSAPERVRTLPTVQACAFLPLRVRAMLAEGNAAEALAAAEALCDLQPTAGDDLFEQARGLAVCADLLDAADRWPASTASARQTLRLRCGARGVDALAQALERGFADAPAIASDEELAPLRKHPTFATLTARYQALRSSRPSR